MKNALFIIAWDDSLSLASELKRRGNTVITHRGSDLQGTDLDEKLAKQMILERVYSDDNIPAFLTFTAYDIFMETFEKVWNQRYLQFETQKKIASHLSDIGWYRAVFSPTFYEPIIESWIPDSVIIVPDDLSIIQRVNMIEQMVTKILSWVYSRGFFTR
jgi:hypothetical protein